VLLRTQCVKMSIESQIEQERPLALTAFLPTLYDNTHFMLISNETALRRKKVLWRIQISFSIYTT